MAQPSFAAVTEHGQQQFCSSPNTASRAQPKGAKTDKHRTLFLGSKCSPGTVLQKGDITLHVSCKAVRIIIHSTLKISSHIQ